ncbi:hypothetical protein LUQ84_001789 [Hamiltosporidium tvaerminnensis]|nr:hypothetical protein LUQ84_001789 [Hamiltosporidium tvaerminnensis]
MNVVFNTLNDTKETICELMYKQFSTKCFNKIKRDVLPERNDSIYIEKMAIGNVNWQYDKYTIKNIERIGLEFGVFERFKDISENVKIFLCKHIMKVDFLAYYEHLLSYNFPVYRITIEKFYTIIDFLEYLRVKHDNKLRNVIKIIWYSLVKSEEINNFDIEKVSFHFSKQDYFSHKMFKKISREYFKVIKFEMNTFDSFFSKKEIK